MASSAEKNRRKELKLKRRELRTSFAVPHNFKEIKKGEPIKKRWVDCKNEIKQVIQNFRTDLLKKQAAEVTEKLEKELIATTEVPT